MQDLDVVKIKLFPQPYNSAPYPLQCERELDNEARASVSAEQPPKSLRSAESEIPKLRTR